MVQPPHSYSTQTRDGQVLGFLLSAVLTLSCSINIKQNRNMLLLSRRPATQFLTILANDDKAKTTPTKILKEITQCCSIKIYKVNRNHSARVELIMAQQVIVKHSLI